MNNMSEAQAAAIMTFSHAPAMYVAEAPAGAEGKGDLVGVEVMNVLGYFPLVGAIIGIARMVFAAAKFKGDDVLKGMFCARAIAEMLCLGPLLMISDAIVSIWLRSKG